MISSSRSCGGLSVDRRVGLVGPCKTHLPVVPTETNEIVQMPRAQTSSLNEIETLSGGPSSDHILRIPHDFILLSAARRSGPTQIERLRGGPSSFSARRVHSYRMQQQEITRRSSSSKDIENLISRSPSSKCFSRSKSLPSVRDVKESKNRISREDTPEYISIKELVKHSQLERRLSPRTPLNDSILERACSAYLQLPVPKKERISSQLWHVLGDAVWRILPISCFTGSSDDESCDRLVDCHNLDNCDGLLSNCRKVD